MRGGVILCGYAMLFFAIAGGMTGCKNLDQPASASFAFVKIGGRTEAEIRNETEKVFRDAEYQATPTEDGFIFEREGTKRDQIAYGGGVEETPVRVRVKTQIVPLGGELFRVQCTAYAVRSGSVFGEEEIRFPGFRRGPFQSLLNEVQKNLTTLTVQRASDDGKTK